MKIEAIGDLETTVAHCGVPRHRLIADGDNGQLRTVNVAWLAPNHDPFEPHTHEDGVEYYIFLKGRGVMVVDEVEVPVGEGTFLTIERGELHELRNPGAIPLQFITIRVILTEYLS
jgi:mannose-6-phosphate isomerase-like protein (cupin superfamily)